MGFSRLKTEDRRKKKVQGAGFAHRNLGEGGVRGARIMDFLVEMKEESRLLFSGTGVRAGYEETDRIFDYFR